MVRNETLLEQRLAFTLYNILKKFDPQKQGYLSLTRFNKIAYLIHKKVQKQYGFNTGIPWYWYKYGPAIALENCPDEIFHVEGVGSELAEQRIYFNEMPLIADLPSNEQEKIENEIQHLSRKYPRTQNLIDIAYGDLESDFLEKFRDFENIFIKFESDIVPEDIGYICPMLDKISRSYPKQGFEELFGLFLRLNEVVRIVCEFNPSIISTQIDFIQQFRELISINASFLFNENMPKNWIPKQKDRLQALKISFENEFADIEKNTYLQIYKRGDDRTGYAKKLMEISHNIAKGD